MGVERELLALGMQLGELSLGLRQLADERDRLKLENDELGEAVWGDKWRHNNHKATVALAESHRQDSAIYDGMLTQMHNPAIAK